MIQPIPLAPSEDDQYLNRLRSAIRPEFLHDIGWNEEMQYLVPRRDHPLLSQECAAEKCGANKAATDTGLCQTCLQNWKLTNISLDQFKQNPTPKRTKKYSPCIIDGCVKGSSTHDGFCYNHSNQYRSSDYQNELQWIRERSPEPILEASHCIVNSCIRSSDIGDLCSTHHKQWSKILKTEVFADPEKEQLEWLKIAEPAGNDYVLILRGLPEPFILETLLALQCRHDNDTKLNFTPFRYILRFARRNGFSRLTDMKPSDFQDRRPDVLSLINSALRDVPRAIGTPESEFNKPIWDMAIFGSNGYLDFSGVEQEWLVTLVKHWTVQDIPRRRSKNATATAAIMINAARRLSESLVQHREDKGARPSDLGRQDMLNHLGRLRHLQATEEITTSTWIRFIRHTRRLLEDARSIGLFEHDGPIPNLSPRFQILKTDVPKEDKKRGPGRDLPSSVIRTILDRIQILEDASGSDTRRLLEILIDTGRRPQEICELSFNCIEINRAGEYSLIYDDQKNYRVGVRLAILKGTAEKILEQQRYVRHKFPDTDDSLLALFPSFYRNPNGARRVTLPSLSTSWQRFVYKIRDELQYKDGTPFPLSKVFLYGFRHAYAQRHADAGTPPDVLRELMGHKDIETTMGYYRITEARSRSALEAVAAMQLDGQGRAIGHSLDKLMEHEHARLRIGQLAVPFGSCSEPSNVKAEGQACPYKFTCLGCSHFSSDPSYLPDLKKYLTYLLKSREELLVSRNIQEWARDKAMPAEQEISQLRNLIGRLEDKLGDLSEDDREAIKRAIDVVRNTRKPVSIGLPYLRTGE